MKKPSETTDVLLISHLTNVSQLTQNNDFYYGDLANNLKAAGISTHTILINHCRVGTESVKKICRTNTTILPVFQATSTELLNIVRLMMAALTIQKTQTTILNDHFIRLARVAQFGNRAIGDLRIGQMITQIISVMQPRVVIYTFEGHGWEKIVAKASHALTCSAHVIGYQHAVVFPGDKTLYHNSGGGTVPDHIFTSGHVTRRLLSNKLTFHKRQVTTLGSIKRKPGLPKPKFDANGTCLFAPEGTLREVHLMARFAIEAAKMYPNAEFVLRLHPVIDPTDIQSILRAWSALPSNFILSNNTLNLDLAAASWICYRGSTVAFQGVLAGLRPIYINPDNSEPSSNPFPKDINFQKCVKNSDDLVKILQEDHSYPNSGQSEIFKAVKFASGYFCPLNPDIAIQHIKNQLS
jgi:hypothetical protein